MARKVRNASLDTRAARSKLTARGKPYYFALDPGLHLGYRKLRGGAGTWVMRRYVGEQNYETRVIATADDLSDANGIDVLDFWQAQTRARELRDGHSRSSSGKGPYTVRQALADYWSFLRGEGRPAALVDENERRANALIVPELGELEVASLTAKRLRAWRDELVKKGARIRSKPGEPQKYREIDEEDSEALRARRASVNRQWASLRAALNHAFAEGLVLSDFEWRRVKPFGGVDSSRKRILKLAEAQRLVNACDDEFRPLLQAALLTGGRYGSLTKLKVRDFNEDAGSLDLRTRKGKGVEKVFSVVLNDEGQDFFRAVCIGRRGDELMFTRADGTPWGVNHQKPQLQRACRRAKIVYININQMRHTWATLALMNGTDKTVVAENLGHRDTRMIDHHYGHLTDEYKKEKIQAGAPRFGFKPDRKVAEIGRSR